MVSVTGFFLYGLKVIQNKLISPSLEPLHKFVYLSIHKLIMGE